MLPFVETPTGAILFTIGVAIVVSLDAMIITVNQYPDFLNEDSGGKLIKRPLTNALLHAFFHTILFLGYLGFIYFSLSIAIPFIFDVPILYIVTAIFSAIGFLFGLDLSRYVDLIESNIPFFYDSFSFFFGLLVIYFVWFTYRSKICEDHSEKPSSRGTQLHPRFDIRVLFRFFRTLPIARNFLNVGIALSVAVDVLAISAFIRVFFKGQVDRGPPNSGHLSFQDVFNNGNSNDIILFALFLFIFVAVCVFLAGCFAWVVARLEQDLLLKIARILCRGFRLLEPVAIFTILGYALSHIIGLNGESAAGAGQGLWLPVLLNWLGFGIVMTGTLVYFHGGLTEIFTASDNGLPFSTKSKRVPKSTLRRESRRIYLYVKKYWRGSLFLLAVALIFTSISIVLFAFMHDGNGDIPYTDFLTAVSGALSVGVALLIFFPGVFADRELVLDEEIKRKGLTFGIFTTRGLTAFLMAFAAIIAFAQFKSWIEGASGIHPVVSEMIHIFLFILVFSTLIGLRTWRYRIQNSSVASAGGRVVKSLDFSDVLTAMGMTILFFQIAANSFQAVP